MSEKKWATRQSFIRKEITTYRIGTLSTNLRFTVSDFLGLIASVHEQIKPFKCNICDASFTKMGQIPIWRIAVF